MDPRFPWGQAAPSLSRVTPFFDMSRLPKDNLTKASALSPDSTTAALGTPRRTPSNLNPKVSKGLNFPNDDGLGRSISIECPLPVAPAILLLRHRRNTENGPWSTVGFWCCRHFSASYPCDKPTVVEGLCFLRWVREGA